MAVAIFFAVGLVVLFIVAHQILQRKTIVGSDKIDARIGQAAIVTVEIARAGQAKAERADLSLVAFPKAPYRVTVSRIPFGP